MIMEIKMNNSLTFDEVADKLGCSVEDLQKIAFKKILFSFGSMESLRTFAVLQVDRIIYLAEQAVKLLIFYMGIFYAHTLGYWRLPIRKLLCALWGRLSTCSSVYGNRFLFAYCLHKQLLNATSYDRFNFIQRNDEFT